MKAVLKRKSKKRNLVKKRQGEEIIEFFFRICAILSVVLLGAILFFVFYKGIHPFLGEDRYSLLSFLTGTRWAPSEGTYGIFYMIVASLLGTAGALCIGFPIGVLTAVFLVFMAPPKVAKMLRPGIELMAGIPSVLYGAFGLGVLVPAIAKISPKVQGQSLLAVILVLSIMILPTVVSLSESALLRVPFTYEEASLGLGATKIQTIFRVILPSAKSGILSAAILGVGRAIGETMAIMMIAGNPTGGIPKGIWSMVRPLTSHIAMEMSYASGRQADMLFATGIILFLFIMIINLILLQLSRKAGADHE